MKKGLLYIFALPLLMLTSCSEDTMDDINKDTAHPAAENVYAKFQITDAVLATSYSVVNGNYAWYVSSYTEQLFGTGNNQLKNVELRLLSETAAASAFNNEWNSTYATLFNLKQMIEKCSEGGKEEGSNDILGMAQTLTALNLGVLTDLHGDVPYSEAMIESISDPKLDKQEDIYENILQLLDDAIANFATKTESDDVKTQDILFHGDNKKWSGLAYALKARYLLHLAGRDQANISKALEAALAAEEEGFDGAVLDVFGKDNNENSWAAYHWSRYYTGSSKTVADLMVERNDPRLDIYNNDECWVLEGVAKENLLGIVGEPGKREHAIITGGYYTPGVNFPLWLENDAATQHIFSKAELYFIIAECKARLNQDAKAEFQTAVKASLADYSDAGGDILDDYTIDDATADDYLAAIDAKFTENPLKEILIQKYIAQARDEQIETYNDIRRCNYMDAEKYPVQLTNPNNNSSVGNRWPLRLPYGESDVRSNPNVLKAFGTGNEAGNYLFTENVWWAGGER